MKKKWRRAKKNIFNSFLNMSPILLRDILLRKQVKLDYNPPQNIQFKLAQTKDEMEQAYRLLYKSYVASGSMQPNKTELRITPYHVLPSTSMLIATVDTKVIATLSIFRISPFGLPVSKIYDISRFTSIGLRSAEISSLCVDDEFKNDNRTLLFGLLKYLYEYSTKYFGIDVKLIVIKPFRRHFYESMLCFKPLENKIITNYAFSNGATVMAEFLNLNEAPELYKKIYNSYPDEQNLYKYFVESKISNFQFPERIYNNISDPVITPELLNYFFIEKTDTLKNMSPFELAVLKNLYKDREYQYLLSDFLKNSSEVKFHRSDERFELKSSAILLATKNSPNRIVNVHDVSLNGVMIYSPIKLQFEGRQRICIVLGPKIYSYLYIEPKWTNGLGHYGFKIVHNDHAWIDFIDHLQSTNPYRKVA